MQIKQKTAAQTSHQVPPQASIACVCPQDDRDGQASPQTPLDPASGIPQDSRADHPQTPPAPASGIPQDSRIKQNGQASQTSRDSRMQLDELLSKTFNSILRVEEKSISNRITAGLTITEVHTIAAVGLYEQNPMNVVASRLGVTLATLTVTVSKLELKGYLKRSRSETDRRKVLLELTKRGKQVYRVHSLFHQQMVDEALSDLSPDEERVLTSALIKVKKFFDAQH